MTQYKLAPIEPTEEIIIGAVLLKMGLPRGTLKKIYKAMIAECQEVESESVMKVTNNGAQLSITKPDGTYWDMSKHIGQEFYTTPQPDRIAELEAKLAKVEVDKARLIAELIHINKKLLSPNEVITALDQGRIDNLLAEMETK